MSTGECKRRLSAIPSADLERYSRLRNLKAVLDTNPIVSGLFGKDSVSAKLQRHKNILESRGTSMRKKPYPRPERIGVLFVLISFWTVCGGCATTYHMGSGCAQPPPSANVLLIEPDVILFELTTGGLEEPRADWTQAAKTNVGKTLDRILREHGDKLFPFQVPLDSPDRVHTYEQVLKLHEAVGQTILIHKYMPYYNLPTKEGRFDWSLGESLTTLKERTRADYALFIYLRDSYASPGRTALMVTAALFGIGIQGGLQLGFASLVDLQTGQIVWFNRLFRTVGDLRTPEAAEKAVQQLLTNIPL